MRYLETRKLRGESGFTLTELIVVVLIAGIVSVAVLSFYLSISRSSADQMTRIQSQDSARSAMYEMSRFIRAACSSESNLTKTSDALVLADPHECVFFVDIDGDDLAERVRYYLSGATLRMQKAEPDTEDSPATYPDEYDSDAVVVLDGVRNDEDAIFSYYGYDEDRGELEEIPDASTDALRRDVVAIGLRLTVNEKPELAKGGVELSTRVLIRQRYDGGISGS